MVVFEMAREKSGNVLYKDGVMGDMAKQEEDKSDEVFGYGLVDEAGFSKKVQNAGNGSTWWGQNCWEELFKESDEFEVKTEEWTATMWLFRSG